MNHHNEIHHLNVGDLEGCTFQSLPLSTRLTTTRFFFFIIFFSLTSFILNY